MNRQLQADLWLALVALIWGSTFVVVKNELTNTGPLAFVAIRFLFALLVMAAFTWRSLIRSGWRQLAAGSLIGVFLFGGYALQTVGLRYTTASKAAFITGLCVVLAPLFARLLLRHVPSRQALVGVALAVMGLALLSLGGDDSALAPTVYLGSEFSLVTHLSPEALGDLLVLGCAACFALHIVAISRFAPRMDSLVLTTVQIGTVALAGIVLAGVLEPLPAIPQMRTLGVAAFMGLVATAFAFTVQNRAQVFTTPTHTALVLSLEPVFGGLFAHLLAGEVLNARQLLGCGLILGGMLMAEVKPGVQEETVSVAQGRSPHGI